MVTKGNYLTHLWSFLNVCVCVQLFYILFAHIFFLVVVMLKEEENIYIYMKSVSN